MAPQNLNRLNACACIFSVVLAKSRRHGALTSTLYACKVAVSGEETRRRLEVLFASSSHMVAILQGTSASGRRKAIDVFLPEPAFCHCYFALEFGNNVHSLPSRHL